MSEETKAAQDPLGRHCYVGAPEVFALGHCCDFLHEAFGEMPFLVGSATLRRDFRDVDLRMIFDDDKWTKLFGERQNGEVNAFWSLLCTSVSEYLAKRTGLKVDFQIQKRSAVSEADWAKVRVPMGLYVSSHEPEWRKDPIG